MFQTRHTRSVSQSVALVSMLLLTMGLATVEAQKVESQTPPPPDTKLPLKAVLVVTPEFCATSIKKGSDATIKETFEVGKVACVELQPALEKVFSSLTSAAETPTSGDAQVVLTPRFVDAAATTTIGAFSNREMDVFLEWTVKDMAGKTVWIDTVEGTSKHHMGNLFTHGKNVKLIVQDSVKDVAAQSANKMSTSAELRKLAR